ncbi:MAG: hypothetical protein IJ679_12135 [Lachnospiraceae bacterium]|nr:hypothetical protein [Lachnospiraceae bacterium]
MRKKQRTNGGRIRKWLAKPLAVLMVASVLPGNVSFVRGAEISEQVDADTMYAENEAADEATWEDSGVVEAEEEAQESEEVASDVVEEPEIEQDDIFEEGIRAQRLVHEEIRRHKDYSLDKDYR